MDRLRDLPFSRCVCRRVPRVSDGPNGWMARALLLGMLILLATGAGASEMRLDFSEAEAGSWFAVNDGVMGGVSSGGLSVEGGMGVFSGDISFENNGGFSSVWHRPTDYDLAGAEGLRLRVRGDGKTYRFRLATPELSEDVSYQLAFATAAGEWSEIELPFADFEPFFHGRRVDAPALDLSRINRLGLLIGEQKGPFQLEIDWIEAYPRPSAPD